jgi:hypothetical protein
VGEIAQRLKAYLNNGGKLLLSGSSGLGADGRFAVPAGIVSRGPVPFTPSYLRAGKQLDSGMTTSPFVVYGTAQAIESEGAQVLADVVQPYFNRSYQHFSSHAHTPDDPDAAPLGAGVTLHDGVAYVAYPIFTIYHAMGQPLYKYLVRGLLEKLLPDPALTTDLPSAGRATLARQEAQGRHVLHLLYGPPQVRGKAVPSGESTRVMEMIEDIPAIGPVSATVRLPNPPSRVYDALSGEDVAWNEAGQGAYRVAVPSLRIHTAIVFEGSV